MAPDPRPEGRYSYGRYDDGPDPLAPPFDLREAMDSIGRDVMEGTSPRQAMRELLRRGLGEDQGLDDLMRRLNERRRRLQRNHRLDGTLAEVRELLERALEAERGSLQPDPSDDARFREMALDALPDSPAGAVQELENYDWRNAEARAAYEQIQELLGREALDQRFQGMKQAMENATGEDVERVREMLSDLNDLLASHARGEDTTALFADFMDRHGQFFPENPQTTEELVDLLAARSAAAQRMMNSLSGEQRAELEGLMQSAFGDPRLAEQLARLDQQLQGMRPEAGWEGQGRFRGQDPMGMGEATRAMEELGRLDALGEQLSQAYPGARLEDIDLDALEGALGPEARVDAQRLAELERELERQGVFQRGADGSLTLSPKALRQLGQSALRDVLGSLSTRRGERETQRAGAAGEATGATRPWAFGDTERWDTSRTLLNAEMRRAGRRSAAKLDPNAGRRSAAKLDPNAGRRSAAKLDPTSTAGDERMLDVADVEIVETEQRTRAAVALCVDTSWSMVADGRWVPMKRTALALHHLVSTRFRGDALQMITFGRHAKTVDLAELTGLEGAWEQGTNLHHALLLANRHLRRHSDAAPVVLVVTDGEPTAHLEPDGHAVFDYPTSPETLRATMTEVEALTRLDASLTVFMLGDDPRLEAFVDHVAQRSGGRVLAPDLDGLGAAVVSDYLRHRRRPR